MTLGSIYLEDVKNVKHCNNIFIAVDRESDCNHISRFTDYVVKLDEFYTIGKKRWRKSIKLW